VERHVQFKRFSQALASGGAGAFILMVLFRHRPDYPHHAGHAAVLVQDGLPAVAGGASLWLLARLSAPAPEIGQRWIAPAAPVLVIWIAALAVLAIAPDGERLI